MNIKKMYPLIASIAIVAFSSMALASSANAMDTVEIEQDISSTTPSFITGGEESDWVAVHVDSGSMFVPGTTDIWASNEPIQSGPAPRLLALDDWTQCWTFKNESWKIEKFSTDYNGTGKTMSIQCGTENSHGYMHIALGKSKHQQSWRNRVASADPQANTDTWDDLMWWAAVQSWKHPLVSVPQDGGKVCRAGLIEMYGPNSSGKIVYKYTFRPTFIWSLTNDRLITAIASTYDDC